LVVHQKGERKNWGRRGGKAEIGRLDCQGVQSAFGDKKNNISAKIGLARCSVHGFWIALLLKTKKLKLKELGRAISRLPRNLHKVTQCKREKSQRVESKKTEDLKNGNDILYTPSRLKTQAKEHEKKEAATKTGLGKQSLRGKSEKPQE